MNNTLLRRVGLSLFAMAMAAPAAYADVHTVTVDGPDAIFLAGRTDVTIPAADQPWSVLIRHSGPTPEEALEQMPSFIPVAGGDIIRALDPAIGGVNFFNGFGPGFFGPGGNGSAGSNLTPLGGISGYIGPQGPLVGVFLDNSIPSGSPPSTLDFSPAGMGIDFGVLAPLLGQIFYIGDGKTGGGAFQEFTAPSGSTRLFLGIPDGFGFGGPPGAYDDNDGSYSVRIGVNQVPTPTPTGVPDGGSLVPILTATLAAMAMARRKLKNQS